MGLVHDPLSEWLDGLIQKESSGREDIVILDVNNKYSYGCLQFQMTTFIDYTTQFDLHGDIMDCGFQKLLAYQMIIDDHGNWRHWRTSVVKRKLGFPPYGKI